MAFVFFVFCDSQESSKVINATHGTESGVSEFPGAAAVAEA
jgi:hypothetical protein